MYYPTFIDVSIRSNWTSVPGNYSNFEYYTGVEIGNPSGSTNNLKRIKYFDGNNVLQFVENFEYNAADQIVHIKATLTE